MKHDNEFNEFEDNLFSEIINDDTTKWLSDVLFGLGFQDLLRERTVEAFNESGVSMEYIDDILEEIIFSSRDRGDNFTAQTAESLRILIKALLGKPVFPWDPSPDIVISRIINYFATVGRS